jgi:hypothetical protein
LNGEAAASRSGITADARGKAADAGDDVACQHRLRVVKPQPLAQCQGPDQPVLLDLMPLDHLRLRRPIRIDAVQRVEDEIGMIARRSEGDDDGVEHAEIRDWNKDQLLGPLRPPDPRRAERRNPSSGSFEQVSSAHADVLPASV